MQITSLVTQALPTHFESVCPHLHKGGTLAPGRHTQAGSWYTPTSWHSGSVSLDPTIAPSFCVPLSLSIGRQVIQGSAGPTLGLSYFVLGKLIAEEAGGCPVSCQASCRLGTFGIQWSHLNSRPWKISESSGKCFCITPCCFHLPEPSVSQKVSELQGLLVS